MIMPEEALGKSPVNLCTSGVQTRDTNVIIVFGRLGSRQLDQLKLVHDYMSLRR